MIHAYVLMITLQVYTSYLDASLTLSP